MFFQLLDTKVDCAGTYIDGQFIWDKIPDGISKTWSYSDHLFNKDIDYAQLLVSGKKISEVCPDHLLERWQKSEDLLKSHFKAAHTSGIRVTDVCFYDLVPRKHLQYYFDTKNEITKWVFENYEKPEHYTLLKNVQAAIKELRRHPIKFNSFACYCYSSDDPKAKYLYEQFGETTPYIDYDLFGTVTGRLSTKSGSFPILNLKKELKHLVTPTNDVFLELDFNAAEIRTMLALQGHEQPQEDIHEWNIKNVFNKEISRDEAKTKIFAWLYNQESKAIQSSYYNREDLLEKYYDGEKIRTPFGRTIAAPVRKALNYLLQSTSSDNTLERFAKISNFLRATKSHVAAVVHDSVIIDLHRDDRRMIPQLQEMFSQTRLGHFKTNVSIGKNLGNMREFKW